MHDYLVVIPARYESTRFPGKPLVEICGKSMIYRVWEKCVQSLSREQVLVATDDERIINHCTENNMNAVLTSKNCLTGTDRIYEVSKTIKSKIYINVQGDEPLIKPETIAKTLSHFEDSSVEIVNIMSRLDSYDQFIDKNNVKVVVDYNSDALYFSREPIPSPWKGIKNLSMYMQTGIIAFRREALLKFNSMDETVLEQTESVDMNRVLEMGGSIRMVATEFKTIGVDTPQELKDSEELMRNDSTLTKYQTL